MAWYLPLYLNTRTWSFSSPGRSMSSTRSMASFVLGILKALHLGTIRASSSMLGNSDARPTGCQAAVARLKGFIAKGERFVSVAVGRNLPPPPHKFLWGLPQPDIPDGIYTEHGLDGQLSSLQYVNESVMTSEVALQATRTIFHTFGYIKSSFCSFTYPFFQWPKEPFLCLTWILLGVWLFYRKETCTSSS